MPDRQPSPEPSEIVERLRKPDTGNETEDVVALVGYVGPGEEGHLRIYADRDLQRWMDIPEGEVVDSSPVESDEGAAGKTLVWVFREPLLDDLFNESVFPALDAEFTNGKVSTWPLIPDSRYVAAELLGLVANRSYWEADEGEQS